MAALTGLRIRGVQYSRGDGKKFGSLSPQAFSVKALIPGGYTEDILRIYRVYPGRFWPGIGIFEQVLTGGLFGLTGFTLRDHAAGKLLRIGLECAEGR